MSLLYYIALTQVVGIGSITTRKLLKLYEKPENIFNEKKSSLLKIPLITYKVLDSLKSKEILIKAEKEIKFTQKYDIDVITIDNDNYPYRLKQIPDAPLVIYVKGDIDLNPLKSIAVVGTRKATEYGKDITKKIVKGLKSSSAHIVSGLAYGIDSVSHKSALENNLLTVAVLGHGLDIIYPDRNRDLAKLIIEKGGALITEYCSETNPDRENFPKRNRIIAGLSDAIVVVEANMKGGALITAELAFSYSRDVFAVPGRAIDTYSQGCNWLIKTNKAGLISSAEDIFYGMNWDLPDQKKEKKQKELLLSDDEEVLYKLIQQHGNPTMDFIYNQSGYSLNKTATILLNMELMGVIKSLPGKMFGVK